MSSGAVQGFTDEHEQLRRSIRAFLRKEVLPQAERWESEGRIPPEGWRSMGQAGLLGFPHSGRAFLRSAVLLEELGRTGYAGIRASVGVHAYMAASYLLRFGADQLRTAYLPTVRRGERIAALAISEEDAGTDLRHLATRAEPDVTVGGYRVSGCKLHVANGSQAAFYICLVRMGGRPATDAGPGTLAGLGLLLVDARAPGVSATPEAMMGWRSADICRVEFDRVPVPAGNVLGRTGHTLSHLMHALEFERLIAGLLAVGGIAHCVELTEDFARTHRVNDAPLTGNQVVRHTLADLRADLELVRQYARHAAILHSQGRLDTATATILKLKSTELAVSAARTCVQYHGAQGYAEGSAPARIHRDAVAGTIAAGVSELMREVIFTAQPAAPDAYQPVNHS